MRVALLVVPLLLAGCTGPEGAFSFSRSGDPLAPYFQEYHEVVAGEHAKSFDVPVDAQARRVNVTLQLDSRTNGLPVPGAPPAQLDARLVAPDGTIVREARLDARAPEAALAVEDVAPGMYRLDVEGFGASQELDGQAYGAGYVVTIEVAYAE